MSLDLLVTCSENTPATADAWPDGLSCWLLTVPHRPLAACDGAAGAALLRSGLPQVRQHRQPCEDCRVCGNSSPQNHMVRRSGPARVCAGVMALQYKGRQHAQRRCHTHSLRLS